MRFLKFPVLLCFLVLLVCGKDSTNEVVSTTNEDALTRTQINEIVFEKLRAHKEFWWSMVDDYTVWSALVQSDKVLSIGYKPAHINNVDEIIHTIDINDTDWTRAREAVVAKIAEVTKNDETFVMADDIRFKDNLPVIHLHTGNIEVVKALRAMKDICRYVEPMGYSMENDYPVNDIDLNAGEIEERDGNGCGSLSTATGVYSSDYYYKDGSYAKVPWTFSAMNVESAWNYSKGDNIAVALFDTGTSDSQSKLRGSYSSGQSTGRYITPKSTHYTTTGYWWWKNTTLDSPHDQCGHGTQMAGTIAAPRTNASSTVGVAYKADLVAYRVTEDVVIGASHEKDGVTDAFVNAANRSDVKIVSMSLGDIFGSGQVTDGVNYAVNSGVLVFCAAGTSTNFTSWYGVIFPAWLGNTVAVTGITDGPYYDNCAICHDGSAVDLVVVMQRASNDNRRSLTLNMNSNSASWVGGSSTATAHTAGVAALVWARNPSQSAASVYQKLKNASHLYPNRNSDFGYGTYDALQAVLQ